MKHQPKESIRAIGAVAALGAAIGTITGVLASGGIGALVLLSLAGALVGALGAVINVTLVNHRGPQPPQPVPPPAPVENFSQTQTSGRLLPAAEARDWLAEVRSILHESADRAERQRYLRSCVLGLPRLMWTIFAEYLKDRWR